MTGAGSRRCRMAIQRIDVTPTEDGATLDTAHTVCTVMAAIRPLGGRERILARAQQDLSTHEIKIPFPSNVTVTAKMQGVYAGRVFAFTSVNNDGELNRELVIAATEVTE